MQESLETTPSDVVLLLDCGYHTIPSRSGRSESNSCFRRVTDARLGRMEILATPSSMSLNDAFFRRALIKILTETSGELVRIDQLRRKIYHLLGDASDPQYANLSRGSDHSSIAIFPSEKVSLDITLNESLNSGNQQALKTWADRAPRQIKTLKFLVREEKSGDGHVKRVSAQIDVASLGDLNKENISSWTKLVPPYVVDIKIQGSVLSAKAKTGNQSLHAIIQMWNQSLGLRTDLTTREGQYKGIVVLPMKWLQDGFDDTSIISQELRDLSDVFRANFDHCEVKPIYEIPAVEGPLKTVTEKIFEVLRGLKSSHLLIVVYNGHGSNTAGQVGQCLLS